MIIIPYLQLLGVSSILTCVGWPILDDFIIALWFAFFNYTYYGIYNHWKTSHCYKWANYWHNHCICFCHIWI